VNDDSMAYCPRCGHDESAFIDLTEHAEVKWLYEMITAQYTLKEIKRLQDMARAGMGRIDIMYIRSLHR
jgi:hypothetical protein